MASSLLNLVDNIAEGIHKIKGKYGHDNKKCKTSGIKYKDCVYCLKYTNKSYQKKFDKNVKKRFASTYKFSNHDINKFILLLAGVFENFRNIYLQIYELGPVHFHSVQGLARQAASKKAKLKLDLLDDIDI